MKRVLQPALALALLSLVSGCGTMMSRGSASVFGAYPFQAVATDAAMMSGAYEDDYEQWLLLGLVSMPFDFVIDLVLSPVDLVAWGMGASKERQQSDAAR